MGQKSHNRLVTGMKMTRQFLTYTYNSMYPSIILHAFVRCSKNAHLGRRLGPRKQRRQRGVSAKNSTPYHDHPSASLTLVPLRHCHSFIVCKEGYILLKACSETLIACLQCVHGPQGCICISDVCSTNRVLLAHSDRCRLTRCNLCICTRKVN